MTLVSPSWLTWSHVTLTYTLTARVDLTRNIIGLDPLSSRPTVVRPTDLDVTIRQCVVSVRNLADGILIKHQTLSDEEIKVLSASLAAVRFVPPCRTTVPDRGSDPLDSVNQRCIDCKSHHVVLQNYEWIITRNQQLQQEVDQLRQETTNLQSALKAHRDTCTCAHAREGSLLALASKVKVEPREDSPIAHMGYGTPPPSSSSSAAHSPATGSSCQYGQENVMMSDSNAPTMQQQQQQQQQRSYGGLQQGSYHQTLPHTSSSFPTTSCSSSVDGGGGGSSYQPHSHPHGLAPFTNNQNEQLGSLGESPDMQVAAVPSHDHLLHRGGGSFAAAAAFAASSATATLFASDRMGGATSLPHLPPATPGGHLTLLEELAYMPGGLRSCVFQEEAATPLSADGRHSISSVSSDVSASSEQQRGHEVARTVAEGQADDVIMGGYVTDEATPDDVSQLLSQINQNDLIFQQDGGMDDVFSDSVANMSCIPEHFLQSI